MGNLKRIDAVYADLPRIECQKKCAEACGPIAMSKVEWVRIERHLGHPLMDVEKVEEHHLLSSGEDQAFTCPLLVDGLCSVHEIRPLICRLFGLVERMRCPFGCEPERWLTDEEVLDIFARVRAISR